MLVQRTLVYSGKAKEMPSRLKAGSLYISTNTDQVFVYGDDMIPSVIAGAESVKIGDEEVSSASGELFYKATTIGSFTLPLISSYSNLDFIMTIKNLSGGNVVVTASGSDLIDGETTQTLADDDAIRLFVDSTGYYII